ncbi:MAG: ArnT family glycosyltransferase [Solirubrobacteraceae bacterium]
MANVNRIVVSTAAGLSAVLVAFAGGYGYHRDELYFVAAGRHLDWAYADQGPFTPLVARAMSEIAPDSLTVLRIPSALAAGATVLLTGLLARELGGGPRAQVIAAACTAVAGLVLFTGHILSTSTFDLLAWTAVTWLAVRAVRGGRRPALARRRRRALLSERDTGPVIALNPDLGETIGWPAFARTVARVYPHGTRAAILIATAARRALSTATAPPSGCPTPIAATTRTATGPTAGRERARRRRRPPPATSCTCVVAASRPASTTGSASTTTSRARVLVCRGPVQRIQANLEGIDRRALAAVEAELGQTTLADLVQRAQPSSDTALDDDAA